VVNAILIAGIAMLIVDEYVVDVLMGDLVGHDRWMADQTKAYRGPQNELYRDSQLLCSTALAHQVRNKNTHVLHRLAVL
jgi:hypothetical protein